MSESEKETRLTVWGIPCPWSGRDSDLTDWRYRAWFWLYRTNQQVRHRLGLHQKPRTYSISPRCDWCGYRNAEQKAVALRNWRAMDESTTNPPADRRRPLCDEREAELP